MQELGGSISAEHGIGRLKAAELAARKSPLELELMRRLKVALDPTGILNPGVILADLRPMTAYTAPLADIRFVLEHIGGLPVVAALPGLEHASPDVVDAVLEEAARLAGNVLAPLNQSGDREGAVLENGVVRTASGFRDAYRAYARVAGWGWPSPRRSAGRICPGSSTPPRPRSGARPISASSSARC